MANHEYFGLKELNSVVIRAYTDMIIGNKKFKKGEPILFFEKLQLGELSENAKAIMARGGWGNFPLVVWDQPGDVTFTFYEGVMSKLSLSILSNAALFDFTNQNKIIEVSKKEELEVQNGKVKLLREPILDRVFIYLINEEGYLDKAITNYTIAGNEITVGEEYNNREIVVDYFFKYSNGFSKYTIGDKRIDGFLTLEAKAYMKSEDDGMNRTFLLEMPKIKITSNLDIIMGEKASPTVSVFNVIGLPIKENNQWIVSKMYLLSDDIDNDI